MGQLSPPSPVGEPPPVAPRDRERDWIRLLRWPVAMVVVAGLLALLAWRLIVAFENAGRAAAGLPAAAAESLGQLARGLLAGNVTETFLAAIPTVAPNAGGVLEVAVAESVESLTRSDEQLAEIAEIADKARGHLCGRSCVQLVISVSGRLVSLSAGRRATKRCPSGETSKSSMG